MSGSWRPTITGSGVGISSCIANFYDKVALQRNRRHLQHYCSVTVRVLSDQSMNIGLLTSPCFVIWSVFCTLVRGYMVVHNQSVSPCFVDHLKKMRGGDSQYLCLELLVGS